MSSPICDRANGQCVYFLADTNRLLNTKNYSLQGTDFDDRSAKPLTSIRCFRISDPVWFFPWKSSQLYSSKFKQDILLGNRERKPRKFPINYFQQFSKEKLRYDKRSIVSKTHPYVFRTLAINLFRLLSFKRFEQTRSTFPQQLLQELKFDTFAWCLLIVIYQTTH